MVLASAPPGKPQNRRTARRWRLPCSRALPGVEIAVYEDRLRRFLKAHPSLAGVGAGYVLAHELAHAMQGEAHHSESGIMKARWDFRDFREMFLQKLAFTTDDVDLIHRGLAARLLGIQNDSPRSGDPKLVHMDVRSFRRESQ